MNTPIKRLGFCIVLLGAGIAAYGAFNLGHFQTLDSCIRYGGHGGCGAVRWGAGTVACGLLLMFALGPLGNWILNGRRKAR